MALKKCIDCGEAFEESLKECPNCGCPSEAIVLCPECGISYSSDLKDCPECGCPNDALVANEVAEADPAPIEETPAEAPVEVVEADVESPEEAETPAETPAVAVAPIEAVETPKVVEEPVEEAKPEEKPVEVAKPATTQSSVIILCRECGEPVPEKSITCPNCGCPVEEGKVLCDECGLLYDENLVECPECGCPNETYDIQKKLEIEKQEQAELQELEVEKRHIAAYQFMLNAARKAEQTNDNTSIWRTVWNGFARCSNFRGRSRRSEMWCFILFNIFVGFILYFCLFSSFGEDYMGLKKSYPDTMVFYNNLLVYCLKKHLVITLVIIGYLLLLIMPSISLVVRRLHDTSRSGYWIFLAVVPFVASMFLSFVPAFLGLGILTIMLMLDSMPDNQYGIRHAN